MLSHLFPCLVITVNVIKENRAMANVIWDWAPSPGKVHRSTVLNEPLVDISTLSFCSFLFVLLSGLSITDALCTRRINNNNIKQMDQY